MKKWYFILSRGKYVEFHLFVEKSFSTAKMWKMWKTRRFWGWKSPENRENPKSCPHRFPHFPTKNVENTEKTKYVRFAQIYLFLEEKWQKNTVKFWEF